MEKEQEKAKNPNRCVRLFNITAASFVFYFNIYDLIASFTNGSVNGFSAPGNAMAIAFFLFNIIYQYRAKPIEINFILLCVIAFLFYVAYLNMVFFQYFVFDGYWRYTVYA